LCPHPRVWRSSLKKRSILWPIVRRRRR
jgi:hypothetical protein